MRLRRASVLVVAAALLAVVAAGCGDDDSDSTQAGGSTTTTEPGSGPGSGPGPGAGGVPSRPAELTGTVTDRQGDRYLVEEQPDSPDAGRKAWVAIEGPVFLEESEGDAPSPATAADIEQGQRVSVWTGICAESYPEQCAAEALVIH